MKKYEVRLAFLSDIWEEITPRIMEFKNDKEAFNGCTNISDCLGLKVRLNEVGKTNGIYFNPKSIDELKRLNEL